jgi:diguanylate cyclase (GGDEF)-like protein/PAS domain S-box-containing protein
MWTRASVALSLVGLLAALGIYLVHELFKRRQLELALVAREAEFRSLAEQSSDMITRISFDGTILYTSPSSRLIVGWNPEQLVGTPALAGANPADMPQLQQIVGQLRAGTLKEARVVYRTRHKERGEAWVESTMRATESSVGQVDGVVAITRDISEQKVIEEKLAALATLDSLTGVANRRHFDERLQQEWARARRDNASIALLMIDVDHFKEFNDHYGHPAGDECLRSIAAIFAAAALRPGDLAARIGGEEFALLLPNTNAAGCQEIAERIRRGLSDLKMPHVLNLPTGFVTVSIGAAIGTSRMLKTATADALVDAADRALYAAKRQGRNRVVFAGELRRVESAA